VCSSDLGGSKGAGFFDAFHNADFRTLALAYVLQLGGLGVFTAATPYYVVFVAERSEGAIASVFVALLGGTIASLFIWAAGARAVGKMRAYLAAAFITMTGLAGLWFAVGPDGWGLALGFTVVVGVGFGGLQLLPFALLTDVIHRARLAGQDSAGAFTGVWTAVEKGGLALGPLVVGVFLSVGGFISAEAAQSDAAHFWIRLAISAAPSVLVLVSLPVVVRIRAAGLAES